MTVSYDSYEALALSYGIEMWAQSGTFQNLTSRSVPKASIIESLGGLPTATGGNDTALAITGASINTSTANFVVMHQALFEAYELAYNTWGHRGSITGHMFLAPVTGDAPYDVLRRMRNALGNIRADLEAQFGQVQRLLRGYVTIDEMAVCDETTTQPGYAAGKLTIHWSSP